MSNLFHTVALLAGMVLLLALLGWALAGRTGLVWASIAALVFLALSPRLPPQLILRMYDARPLAREEAPELHWFVGELARLAHLPATPRLYYVPSRLMNSFAVGGSDDAAIGVTDGLLRRLDVRELSAVLAHEVSHIAHDDLRVMALADVISRITHFFSLSGQMLLLINLPLLLMGSVTVSWLAILLLMAAPTLTGLLQLALSRTREFDADLGAARLTGDPEGLALALAKMEYYQSSFFTRIFLPGHGVPGPSILRTHPPTEERIRRLLALVEEVRPTVTHEEPTGFVLMPAPRVTHGPRWRMSGSWY